MHKHTPGPWSTNDLLTGGTVVLHNAKPGYRARLDDAGRFNAHDAALIADSAAACSAGSRRPRKWQTSNIGAAATTCR